MKTKHTAGQWIKGTNTASRDWMQIYCNGKMIASVKELSKKGERKATDLEEEGANVALIAAAPELLEALQNMLWNFEGKPNLSEVQKAAIVYAKAAINKAIT